MLRGRAFAPAVVIVLLAAGFARPAGDAPPGFDATVLHAVDAGTLLVRPAGASKPITVKLIGLTAPVKATRDADGQEPWATRGQQALAVLAGRKAVRVELDALRLDPATGALWGYVWVPHVGGPDVLANEAILAGGHAVLDTRPPNVAHVERLRAVQTAARAAGKNIWDAKEPLTESPAEYARKMAALKADVATLTKWEAGCVIGNAKSKKYHMPGGQYYAQSTTSKQAVFFKTEADARQAGYEKAAR